MIDSSTGETPRPTGPPRAAPPVDDPFTARLLAAAVAPRPHTGVRGLIYTASRGLINVGPSAAELGRLPQQVRILPALPDQHPTTVASPATSTTVRLDGPRRACRRSRGVTRRCARAVGAGAALGVAAGLAVFGLPQPTAAPTPIPGLVAMSTLTSSRVMSDDPVQACRWRISALVLYQELATQTDARSVAIRTTLGDAGVGAPGFVPLPCLDTSIIGSLSDTATPTPAGPRPGTATTAPSPAPSARTSSGTSRSSKGGAAAGGAAAAGTAGSGTGHCPTTAAQALGWGTPNRESNFGSGSGTSGWSLYDGPGHDGNGRRTPAAVSVANGVLTITGSESGDSEGMAWEPGQKYGRWEACVRSTTAADSFHSVLLLWPDAGNWPEGGEVDFMEISDPARQSVDGFLHYGAANEQESASTNVDATQWHAWAVEWTADHITYYVDGKQWFRTTDTTHLPPGPMHMTIQLDNFGGDLSKGGQEIVAWARQYGTGG